MSFAEGKGEWEAYCAYCSMTEEGRTGGGLPPPFPLQEQIFLTQFGEELSNLPPTLPYNIRRENP